jgi:hypothetical protein
MKKFEQLHITDQMVILARVIGMLADGGQKSIEQVATAKEQTVLDVWRDICAGAGIEECVPWRGFSGPPKCLPMAPGGERLWHDAGANQLDRLTHPERQ